MVSGFKGLVSGSSLVGPFRAGIQINGGRQAACGSYRFHSLARNTAQILSSREAQQDWRARQCSDRQGTETLRHLSHLCSIARQAFAFAEESDDAHPT